MDCGSDSDADLLVTLVMERDDSVHGRAYFRQRRRVKFRRGIVGRNIKEHGDLLRSRKFQKHPEWKLGLYRSLYRLSYGV